MKDATLVALYIQLNTMNDNKTVRKRQELELDIFIFRLLLHLN